MFAQTVPPQYGVINGQYAGYNVQSVATIVPPHYQYPTAGADMVSDINVQKGCIVRVFLTTFTKYMSLILLWDYANTKGY